MFRNLSLGVRLLAVTALLIACASRLKAQSYLENVGIPTFTTALPVENGFVNAGNGNLHIEIPLGSFPQRGGRQYRVALVYDSAVWQPVNGAWQPTNVSTADGSASSWFGWRLVTSGDIGIVHPSSAGTNCYYPFIWTAPDGTQHSFPIKTAYTATNGCSMPDTPSGDAFASDASGYHMHVSNYTHSYINSSDGTKVYDDTSTSSQRVEDSNGNYYLFSSGTITDTLGRIPVTTTLNQGTLSYTLPNAEGTNSTFSLTFTANTASTSFGQTGITECCSFNHYYQLLNQVTLPDGTTYKFGYEFGFDLLNSITLPSGATITYTYTLFSDAYGNKYRWVNFRKTPNGYTWGYGPGLITSCTTTQVNCQQQMQVTKPTGDTINYTFYLNGGSWNSKVQYSGWNGVVLATLLQCFNFVSVGSNGQCTYPSSPTAGPANTGVTKSAITTLLPIPGGTISKTSEYFVGGNTGNLNQVSEWNFYTGNLPTVADRSTCITYLSAGGYTSADILNRPTSVTTVNNWSTTPCTSIPTANIVKQTNYAYDGSTLASATGMKNHDDSNYGVVNTVRGNITQTQQLVSSGSYLSTSATYDMTGQSVSSTDSGGNLTTFSYADNFFTDPGNGSNPIAYSPATATNAYLTGITEGSLSSSMGYYYWTGQQATAKDPNGNSSYSHFADVLDRQTATSLPNGGWSLTQYNSTETQIDTYTSITASTPTTSCTGTSGGCRHDQTLLDSSGRTISQLLVSDPDSQSRADTQYDINGRVLSVSNPYRSTSDPTYGLETATYDGLDRKVQINHADQNPTNAYYGAAVSSIAGRTSPVSGVGYPVATQDETGRVKQVWIDGFGRTIEVDESSSVNGSSTPATHSSGFVTISGQEKHNLYAMYDSGRISVGINYGALLSTTYGQYDNPYSLAGKLAGAINQNSSIVTATVDSACTSQSTSCKVDLVSTGTGAVTNYSLTASSVSFQPGTFSPPSFSAVPSGATLTGGADESPSLVTAAAITAYAYDLNNNLTGVTAATGPQTRSYQYDQLSRVTQKTEPETGTTHFYYTTSAGAVCSGDPSAVCRRIDARGITATYGYNDSLNRLTSKTYSDSTPAVTYYYDQTTYNGLTITNGKGRRTGMSDGSGQSAWSFDQVGNVKTEQRTINGVTKAISYTYNFDTSISSITYPSGRTVSYTVGNAQRPTVATDTANSINYASASSVAMYAPNGAPASIVYGYVSGGGITETRSYNNRFELTGIQAVSQGTLTTVLNLGYAYTQASTTAGNNGNILTQTNNVDTGRTQNYTYDNLNRLLTAQTQATSGADCWGQSFGNNATPPTMATDALANLFYATSIQCSSPQPRFTMNPSPYNNEFTGTGISYDLDGNNTADTVNSYTYDAENRIITASGSGMQGSPYCYTYDGNGMRVEKANASGGSCTGTPTVDVLYWRNIAGNTIAETNATGSTSNANYHEYVFFAGRRVARSDVSTGSVYYYFVDHLGSTRIMTQANGTVCFDAEYFPYGQELDHTNTCNTISTTYKFTGYERDSETGLDYAFARYYNARLGRFMSGDPLGGGTSDPQSLNRYAYASNNPVNFIDPSGLDPCLTVSDPACIGVTATGSLGNSTGPAAVGGDFGLGGSGNGGGPAWPVGCEYSRLCLCHWRGNCAIVFPPPKHPTTQPPTQPPSTPPSRLTCAVNFGQNHSIAAAFGAQNSFVGNLFGGNTFSGLVSLGQQVFGNEVPTAGGIATTILSGGGQGLPGDNPGFKGVAGRANDAILGTAVAIGYNTFAGVGQETLELGINASGKVAAIAAPLAESTVSAVVSDLNSAKLAWDLATFAYGYFEACK